MLLPNQKPKLASTLLNPLPVYRPALFLTLAALVAALFTTDLFLGSVSIPFSDTFNILTGNGPARKEWEMVIFAIRLPKALTALLCGVGLSLGGLLTQSLFRNPLTGPDVLGLTSGAGVGVAFAVMAGFSAGFPLSLAASAGAAISFSIISMAASRVSNNTLLIIGLMFSAFASAIVSVLQFFSGSAQLQQYTIWTMGSISIPSGEQLGILSIAIPACLVLAFTSVKSLNANLLGDFYLKSAGLNPAVLRWKVLISASVLTGIITAICGPVTFIGIAGPHLVKQFFRITDHRQLVPLSALSGAGLVLLCDLLTQLPGSGSILPLNAVTALFGAPVVIWVILRTKESGR